MPISDPDGLRPGTVVVVPFPYSDRLAEKRRPAVVISGSTVADAGFVWIAMVTSARNPTKTGDLPIDDIAHAGLKTASVVRPVKIACIEQERVLKRIGDLPPDAAERRCGRIRDMVGTSRSLS